MFAFLLLSSKGYRKDLAVFDYYGSNERAGRNIFPNTKACLLERGSEICAYVALVFIIQERLLGLALFCGWMVAIWPSSGR